MRKFILAAFILYLPFQLKLPQIPVINTVNFFLIILAILFIFTQSRNQIKAKFDIPLLLFLIVWIVSFAHTLSYGVEVWRYEITILFKRLISLVLVYFVFSRCIKTKKEWQFLFYAFLLSVAITALFTWRGGMLAGPHFTDFKRSSGPFGEGWRGADIAGAFLAIFTPFLLTHSFFTKQRIAKVLGFLGVGICLMGLFATYSRGSILALAISSFAVVLISFPRIFKASKLTAVIILIGLIGLGLMWERWIPQSIIHRVQGTTVEEEYDTEEVIFDQSSQKRMDKWGKGIEIFNYNPLFGVGFRIPEFVLGTDTHNAFIQIAAEMGISGISFFILFLFTVFLQARALLRTEFDYFGIGLMGCLVAFIFVNMFYSNFFRDTVAGTFWAVLGLSVAATGVAQEEKKSRSNETITYGAGTAT
jgi:O-antigen ligase